MEDRAAARTRKPNVVIERPLDGEPMAYPMEEMGASVVMLSGYSGQFVDVATDHPVDAALSTSLNFNQGCCASPAANRTQVGIDVKLGVSRPWGYCTHTPVSTPAPYPPFDCEVAKAGTVGNSV